ncbi:MAG: mannose-1-phosphate guanylyltransferase/mannose-6-phosphate isomerase [Desulfuromonadales bacterium]|jgi:mannose-1-phosphate guanylyltransferase/mannose-6-phosphate isomerase|nr:mannose-1-phosphate guanylyltransferase/mannose-6-phosphate isomerase [Desulfuromonadales bacterium]
MIIPVILSGGAGTRLWPLSRELYPKQLLPLVGERTMLQETVLRLEGLADLGAPLVVCNDAHRFMVAEQLRLVGQAADTVILEPVGRNTAPAVAVAALQAMADGSDPLLLVLAADHVIRDAAALCAAVNAGVAAVQAGALLTFGIVPTAPETGYGYIRAGGKHRDAKPGSSPQAPAAAIYDVLQFVEKPDLKTAEGYLACGDYYWNSGMFFFKASAYLAELKKTAPQMLAACELAWQGRVSDLDFTRLDAEAFAACPSDSIDYAVMEKTDHAVVIPLDAGWSDVGSWAALWEVGEADGQGNVCAGDVISIDCRDSYLYSGTRLVAGIGLQDAVVIETADAILVAAKDRVQEVKQVVAQLKQLERQEYLLHRRVNRPWGAYEGLDAGDGFLVKRITVNPGASLSLQSHRHRAEHWVVVRGSAEVTCENVILNLEPNQSAYIPIGAKHRLRNPGDTILEIIEVQTGELLLEDDIERFEDQYGR